MSVLSAPVVASESDKNVTSIAFLKYAMIGCCFSFFCWMDTFYEERNRSELKRCRLKNRAKRVIWKEGKSFLLLIFSKQLK